MTTLTTSGWDINKKCNENLADKHWLIPPPPTALGNDFYSKHHATNSELTEERCKIVSFRRSRLLLFDNRKNPYEITTISATFSKAASYPDVSLCLDEHLGAKEDGKEKTGVSDFSLSHGPLRFVTSYSRFHLASDICLTCAKNEGSEQGTASSKCVPVKLSLTATCQMCS